MLQPKWQNVVTKYSKLPFATTLLVCGSPETFPVEIQNLV